MTTELIARSTPPVAQAISSDKETRQAIRQRYLMCRPSHFEVSYSINHWMDLEVPVDTRLALKQWTVLLETFQSLGHEVEVMDDVPGLPDMVFTANAGIVRGDLALVSRFQSHHRQAEEPYFERWFASQGFVVHRPEVINEGEGDFLWTGSLMLGGSGFRSDARAASGVTDILGVPATTLQLIDPRWYHIDTALCVLDSKTIAFVPEAFSEGSIRALRTICPNPIEVSIADAEWFALNAVSDGKNVVVAEQARSFQIQLTERGFTPVPVDMSEFLKSGGGAKCCTLILNR